ncbi:MAG: hypothetical protein IH612_08560, partial [Desulfofustis sp.]|nr:hypothetical protein [Desulfofustis sp.]
MSETSEELALVKHIRSGGGDGNAGKAIRLANEFTGVKPAEYDQLLIATREMYRKGQFCSGSGKRSLVARAVTGSNEVTYDHWLDITLLIPSIPTARDSPAY